MDFSFCISLPPLRKKCHESILTPDFRSCWECLPLRNRYRSISFIFCNWLHKTKFVSVTRGAFSERVEMTLPTKVSSLAPESDSGFFELKEKLHKKGRVENTSYVFTRTWSGKAEHSLRSVWGSRQRLVLHFFSGMTALGWLWVCCLTWSSVLWLAAKRGGCFWEVISPPLEKCFTLEVAEWVERTAKAQTKGCQPLLAGWVHGKVKKLHILHADPKPWDSLLHGARGKAISIDDWM